MTQSTPYIGLWRSDLIRENEGKFKVMAHVRSGT